MYIKTLLLLLSLMLMMALQTVAQEAVLTQQRHFAATVPAGNYSGITWLGDSLYAVVDDKSQQAGFSIMTIDIDSVSGEVLNARRDTVLTSGQPNRDEEGICFFPHARTLFISSEADGQILEYRLDGSLTGRGLHVPDVFRTAYPNSGFEALTYNATTHRFWTTSEQTLQADGVRPDALHQVSNRLRLQSFDDDLQPLDQYWYQTDSTAIGTRRGDSVLGVSALAALDDGRLIVLEREVFTAAKKIGSFVEVKLYVVNPESHPSGTLLSKQLLTSFRTKINVTARSFANYEGMCLGPRLVDGRQVLLLIADSQNQYRGYLRDWFRTVVF